MMTDATTAGYVVRLRDCSTVTIAADDLTTRHDGSLWLLQHINPERAALPRTRPLLILNRNEWRAAYPAGTNPLEAASDTETAEQPPRILAQCTDIADPLGRREVVAERLAQYET